MNKLETKLTLLLISWRILAFSAEDDDVLHHLGKGVRRGDLCIQMLHAGLLSRSQQPEMTFELNEFYGWKGSCLPLPRPLLWPVVNSFIKGVHDLLYRITCFLQLDGWASGILGGGRIVKRWYRRGGGPPFVRGFKIGSLAISDLPRVRR